MKRKITPVAVVDYLLAFFDRLLETLCQSLLSGMLACEGIRCYGAMAGRVGRCYAPHWAMSGGYDPSGAVASSRPPVASSLVGWM